MKRGKEIKIDQYQNYNVIYGTVDSKSPTSIYLELSAWGQPKTSEDIDYNRVIKSLHKRIKQIVSDDIDTTIFSDKIIIDVDMRESGIRFNKRSYIDCEVTFFQLGKLSLTDDKIISTVKRLSKLISDELNTSEYFNFFKTKK
jgi:hypothetical protein